MLSESSLSSPRRLVAGALLLARSGLLAWVVFVLAPAASAAPEELVVRVGDERKTFTSAEVSAWYAVRTERHIQRDVRSEAESADGCPALPSYCAFVISPRMRDHFVVDTHDSIRSDRIAETLHILGRELNRPPTNARFTVSDGAIIVAEPDRLGHELSVTEATAVLSNALLDGRPDTEIILPTATTTPAIRAEDKERLGLHGLIGEGKTNFSGSPKNRVFNINRALQEFDGVLLAPDEEFSFVDRLGPVDGEHGYLPELVIKHNRTEPEFGGGICQVSSTFFRAAFNSGFKITERRNHAYPVQYYKPYGMDATIYIPKPDLKFRNNTPGYVLLQPKVEGFNLIVQAFGTNDGRSVVIDGPHILERRDDGGMRTLFTQTVTDATGATIIEDNFFSNYKSPSLFPHPGDEILTTKPKNWSEKEWREYLKTRPAGR